MCPRTAELREDAVPTLAEWRELADALNGQASVIDERWKQALLESAADARGHIGTLLVRVEQEFYSRIGAAARQAGELIEWAVRDPLAILNEQIGRDARDCFRSDLNSPSWSSIDWGVWDVQVTYTVRPGENGEPTVVGPPSARRRRRGAP